MAAPAQFSLVEAPLMGGIDQSIDPRKLPGVKLLTGTNAQINRNGAYDKRFGTTSVASLGETISLAGYDGALVAAGGSGMISKFSSSTYGFTSGDQLPEVTDTIARTVAATVSGVFDMDSAYYSTTGLLVYCWCTTNDANGGDVYTVGIERATGLVVSGPTKVTSSANAHGPKIVMCGATAVIAWHQNGSGNIPGVRATVSSVNYTWSAVTNITTDSQSTNEGVFDIDGIDSTTFMFVYERNAGTNRCRLAKITASTFAVSGSTLDLTDSVTGRMAICVDVQASERTWVAYAYLDGANAEVHAAIVDESAMAETVAPTLIESQAAGGLTRAHVDITRYDSQGAVMSWFLVGTTNTNNQLRGANINTSCVVAAGGVRFLGYYLLPLSRQFVRSTKTYQLVHATQMAPTATPSVFLIDTGGDLGAISGVQARVVSNVCPRYAPANDNLHRTGHLSRPVSVSSSEVRVLGAEALGASVTGLTTPFLTEYTFMFETLKRRLVEYGGLLYASGGVPMWFDGVRAAEASFFAMGLVSGLVGSNGAGSLTTSSTYAYKSCFIQRDRKGNVHRSGAGTAASVTLGVADDTVDGVLKYYTVTARSDFLNTFAGVYIENYRTKANGEIYFRLTSELATTVNSTSDADGSVAFTDLATDASIGSNEIIYTQGAPTLGQLDNVCPPSASIMCVHRDRLWLAGCPNRKQIWPSKKWVPGVASGFNEALVTTVDDGGDITALASMDGRLIIFKSDRIFYLDGDGPNNLGQNNDWGAPVRVNGTVGCIDARSVVVTPIGIVFQSNVAGGLSLLDRGLNVVAQWGEPVQDEFVTYNTVVYAILHPTRTEIRFGVVRSSNAVGKELRYDYSANAWFTAEYTHSGGALIPQSATVIGTNYYFSVTSGEVFVESTTSYLDDSDTYVTRTLELAPVSIGGALGHQSVSDIELLCERHTAHECKIQVAIDGGSYTESKQWTAADTNSLTEYALQFKPQRAGKARQLKVKITDLTPTSGSVDTGRGFTLAAVNVRAAALDGPAKQLGSAQKG